MREEIRNQEVLCCPSKGDQTPPPTLASCIPFYNLKTQTPHYHLSNPPPPVLWTQECQRTVIIANVQYVHVSPCVCNTILFREWVPLFPH